MLAQKELQLIDFQELHGSLQAERDGLKVELQHLKTKYYKMLKQAQEQAHRIMVNAEAKFSDSTILLLIFHNIIVLFIWEAV